MNMNELIEREQNRAECFKYMSAALYQPDKGLYQEEGFFENLKQALSQAFPDALCYVEQMERSFNECIEEALLVDYAALFIGPFELKAPPYASSYIEGDRRLIGNFTMALLDFYKSSGLEISNDFNDSPDHIKVMLEFVYYLIYEEVKALKGKKNNEAVVLLETQKGFLNTFLLTWIDQFCQKINENAAVGYYLALAECLLIVVKASLSICDDTLSCLNSFC